MRFPCAAGRKESHLALGAADPTALRLEDISPDQGAQ